MNWPLHPEYKDSGIDWLGQIPADWEVGKFRHCFRESSEKNGAVPVGTMLAVSGYRGVEVKEYDDDNQRRTDEQLEDYRVVRVGQLAVNTMWLNYAGLGVSEFEGHISPAYRSYWIDKDLDKRYVHHLMRSSAYVDGYTALLTGVRPNSLQMGRDDLMGFPVLRPPLPEQQIIARFLDGETVQIDELITKQEQLIATLREDRTATIVHAVTKGLDPDAEVKDSGITWVGSMPSTWDVEKVSRIFRANKSPNAATLTKEYCAGFPGDYPVYSGQTAEEGVLARVDFYEFDVGDTGALLSTTVGAKAMSIAHIFGRFNLSQNCMVIRSISSVDIRFFYYHFQALFRYERQFVSEHMQASFRMEDLYGFRILVPPLADQRRIAKHLDKRCCRIDALIAKANEVIETLREYRSALITDAVTGKIDVRGAA